MVISAWFRFMPPCWVLKTNIKAPLVLNMSTLFFCVFSAIKQEILNQGGFFFLLFFRCRQGIVTFILK